jgi:hypothetical protein
MTGREFLFLFSLSCFLWCGARVVLLVFVVVGGRGISRCGAALLSDAR